MGNDYGKLAGNPGQEYVRLRGGMVPGSRRPTLRLPCGLWGRPICRGQNAPFHGKEAVLRAAGIAVNVIPDFIKRAFIPWVVRDESFGEMEFIFRETVSFNGVKSRITKEGVGVEIRVQCKEISEDWL